MLFSFTLQQIVVSWISFRAAIMIGGLFHSRAGLLSLVIPEL
jgi:hypothetical protein